MHAWLQPGIVDGLAEPFGGGALAPASPHGNATSSKIADFAAARYHRVCRAPRSGLCPGATLPPGRAIAPALAAARPGRGGPDLLLQTCEGVKSEGSPAHLPATIPVAAPVCRRGRRRAVIHS